MVNCSQHEMEVTDMKDSEKILSFKDKMRGIRTIENITMVELSRRTGLSQSYISQLENGKLPTDENLWKIAHGLAGEKKEHGKLLAESYEAALRMSRDNDELLNKQQALIEATQKFQFENSGVRDKFIDDLDNKIAQANKMKLVHKVSDFFGLYEDSYIDDKENPDLLIKYNLLNNSQKKKLADYLNYLIFEQNQNPSYFSDDNSIENKST